MCAAKNVVESFRDVVQDLLVPELKAVKVSVDALRIEMRLTNEAIRTEIKLSNDAVRTEIRLSNEAIRDEIKLRTENLERLMLAGDEANRQLIRSLADKFDSSAEVRERLAVLEARMPRQ